MPRGRSALTDVEATPLFFAEELSELERREAERDALIARIRRLPPRSHLRIIREHELSRVVAQILRLELKLHGSPR